jgi:hypothetical protein
MFFLRPIVLNQGKPPDIVNDRPADVALTLAISDLKARFIDAEQGVIRYQDIRGSEAFDRYKGLSRMLCSFDLRSLQSREQGLAFWINIYNAAVIHGVIEFGLRRSVRELPRFFDRVVYLIGGEHFSLNAIEHGILRGNRRPPYGFRRPFGAKDPRLGLVVSPMDPRVHFALVCGARSCPPIAFYESEQIDFQLQLAAASFINSARVRLVPHEKTVYVSMIFKWYRSDFGGSPKSLIDTLIRFLDDGEAKEFLRKERERIRIRYVSYDWNLNGS